MVNLEQQLSMTEGQRPPRKGGAVSFLLCNSCYWCASSITELTGDDLHCPSCGQVVESIPLGTGEVFSLGIDAKRGVVLEFKKALRNAA
ncbi:hypothetical protein [Candidatus Nitrososphaera evergladensis]|jgi:hypothetical protein|nr:hypothetical protein [Candidatus Nitrososphaera evergladensis]